MRAGPRSAAPAPRTIPAAGAPHDPRGRRPARSPRPAPRTIPAADLHGMQSLSAGRPGRLLLVGSLHRAQVPWRTTSQDYHKRKNRAKQTAYGTDPPSRATLLASGASLCCILSSSARIHTIGGPAPCRLSVRAPRAQQSGPPRPSVRPGRARAAFGPAAPPRPSARPRPRGLRPGRARAAFGPGPARGLRAHARGAVGSSSNAALPR